MAQEPSKSILRKMLAITCVAGALLAAAGFLVLFMLNGQMQSMLSRMRSDLRSLAHALAQFKADHGRYPEAVSIKPWLPANPPDDAARLDYYKLCTINPGTSSMPGITTPMAYITQLWSDPMSPAPRLSPRDGVPLAYWSDGSRYLLYAVGANTEYDIIPQRDLQGLTSSTTLLNRLVLKVYDPTNGVISPGDLCWIEE